MRAVRSIRDIENVRAAIQPKTSVPLGAEYKAHTQHSTLAEIIARPKILMQFS